MRTMTLTEKDLDAIRQIVREELAPALDTLIKTNAQLFSSLPLDERKRQLVEWGGAGMFQFDTTGNDVKP